MNYNEFISLLFAKAERAGFTLYEANYSAGKSFFVSVREQEVEKHTVNSFSRLTFKVIKDKRSASFVTTAFNEETADIMIDQLKDNLSVINSTDECFIFGGSESYAQLNEFSSELAHVSDAKKIELAKEIEAEALKCEGITKVMMSVVAYTESQNAMRNSKGLDLKSENNYIYAYCMPVASDGEKANNALDYIFTKNIDDIKPEILAKNAAKKALDGLHPSKVKTGRYSAVFGGECFCDLMDAFSSVFSAESAQKGLSLLADKLGQAVASACITLCDDPLSPLCVIHDAYDDEGVATASKRVIDNGVLTTLLYNLKTANKAGVQSTGNASGDSVAPSCMFIMPSDKSRQQLFNAVGNGLYITELNGMHSGTNAASGDFSLSAKGYLITNGEQRGSVSDFVITGNFYSLLKSITAVSDTITWALPPQFGSPDILVLADNNDGNDIKNGGIMVSGV